MLLEASEFPPSRAVLCLNFTVFLFFTEAANTFPDTAAPTPDSSLRHLFGISDRGPLASQLPPRWNQRSGNLLKLSLPLLSCLSDLFPIFNFTVL